MQLDSKNSPLALLAQTCSSIGKDSGSASKLSLPSLGDKKDSSSSSSSSSCHQRENNVKDCKQRTSDSPMGCSVPGSSSSRTSGDTGRSNKSSAADKSSKDCSSRSNSGGGESSPKSRGAHSSRPISSLVSLGNGSGKCTPSSANTFASGSGSLHRDYNSTTRGASTTSSTSGGGGGGVALAPSSALNNNNKTIGETGSSSSSLLYDAYSDDILKSSGLASSSFLQHQHSLQEALRMQHEGLQSLQAAAAAGLGPLPSGYPPLLFGHPLAAAAALDPLMYSYSASLAAVHGLALTSHKLPTLSPYMGYARVSTASGGSTLVPVCKDPYCTTGSLHSGHSLQPHAPPGASASAPCGAGCTQCGSSAAQDKSHQCTVAPPATSLANGVGGLVSAGQFSSSLYPLSLPPGGLANPLLGMAAAAHLGVGLTPYACSWLSGGEFCGKRFSKAEDLLQHLRTHASSGETAALPAFSLSGVPLPSPAAFAVAGHPFTIPGSLSPSSMLQQAGGGQVYPRSLSPNSLLSASRYHPYKSPFAAVLPTSTVGGTLGGAAGSTLDAYYSSPYALYGHRIGAATVGP